MGHSAGAQMCTMALLHRALSASKAAEQRQAAAATAEGLRGSGRSASNGSSSSSKAVKVPAPLPAQASAAAAQEQQRGQQQGAEGAEAAAYADHRMPKRLVAVAGVFDLGKHYEYEEGKGSGEECGAGRGVIRREVGDGARECERVRGRYGAEHSMHSMHSMTHFLLPLLT